MFTLGRFCHLKWHENLPNLQVRTISGSENLDFILVPLLLSLWFRELELQPHSSTTTTLGVQRTWSLSVFGSMSALRGSENLGPCTRSRRSLHSSWCRELGLCRCSHGHPLCKVCRTWAVFINVPVTS
jgi:hypothetical protein